ncbi:MAG: hypothetical protein H6999_05940 [Hahellaceae bacterium]|nr:hypothetical protein [Hahellaceae bacterium]MCP5169281.1 hypothetical protein [Hahellaceae bacterium]
MKNKILCIALVSCCGLGVISPVWAETAGSPEHFKHKEKSTIDTIRLKAADQDELAAAVIEGGLEATSAGPVSSAESIPAYQERTLAEPLDKQTDLGRHEIPATIIFQNERSVPGQTFTGNYVIEPPANRNYQEFNFNTTAR